MKKGFALILCLLLMTGAAFALDTIYYCPKCGSENTAVYADVALPEPERKSLDEAESHLYPYKTVNAVARLVPWVAKCRDCGYEKRFYR